MRAIIGFVLFYARFGLSFSVIGYLVRQLYWPAMGDEIRGKTVLITGASGGIGAAVADAAVQAGAQVIAVARNPEKLAALQQRLGARCTTLQCDLADTDAVRGLVNGLVAREQSVDVLVNNVGVLLPDYATNAAGVDEQFATNLLNPYLLTELLVERQLLSEEGCVVTVASGGMYMAPLQVAGLSSDSAEQHDGTRAYAIQKRAQVMLTRHWQSVYGGDGRDFHVMHPGWVDTAGVQRSLPTFRTLLRPVLRSQAQGADTIVWLAATRPAAGDDEVIWLDRKARKVHAYSFTRTHSQSLEALVDFLKRFL